MSSHTERYREHRPSPQLTEFVECYWTMQGVGGESHLILPDGCTDLLIDRQEDNHTSRVVGTMTRALSLTGTVKRDTIAVRFTPGGAWALLGISPIELVDTAVSMETICQRPGPPVATLPPQHALIKLDRWLLSQLPKVCEGMRDAARIARACIGFRSCNVTELSDTLGMSRQHLRRQVLAATGIGPKQLSRIGRMRRLSDWIAAGSIPSAKTAVLAGYFDQAHMVNEFRQLTGITPGAYEKSLRLS